MNEVKKNNLNMPFIMKTKTVFNIFFNKKTFLFKFYKVLELESYFITLFLFKV